MLGSRTYAARHGLSRLRSFNGRHATRRWQYNNSMPNQSIPHTTYFQPPPPPPLARRSILRSVLMSTLWFTAGAALATVLVVQAKMTALDIAEPEEFQSVLNAVRTQLEAIAAESGIPPYPGWYKTIMQARSNQALSEGFLSHTAQLPSNTPCEDVSVTASLVTDPDPDPKRLVDASGNWQAWAIYDGHAGPRTADLLGKELLAFVTHHLSDAGCFGLPYVPNDPRIHSTICNGFRALDDLSMQAAARYIEGLNTDRSEAVYLTSPAVSGSCALMALFDPANNVLRVANTGDSRAVLGRWDEQSGRYVARALSNDHTGFNPDEVARLKREHPGEDVVDPETGRIFGIAVSRAFGDGRWKWPAAVTQRCHELLWGPEPRPDNVVKTPPYLTAEPEIIETRIQRSGEHPDFVIMASDGLWDNLSNDHAVECVQMWLDKFQPSGIFTQDLAAERDILATALLSGTLGTVPEEGPAQASQKPVFPPKLSQRQPQTSEDTFYDAEARTLRWHTRPEHFIVEDMHCGEHLIRNALGGNRTDLFASILAVPPPYSRNVRDDISVHVIFFGDYHYIEQPGPNDFLLSK